MTRSTSRAMNQESNNKAKKTFQTPTSKKTKTKRFRGLGYVAERLNGCDISDMVPAQVSDAYSDHNKNQSIVKKWKE